jgi:hypothetical protein
VRTAGLIEQFFGPERIAPTGCPRFCCHGVVNP